VHRSLFDETTLPGPAVADAPAGFHYRPEFLSPDEEERLVAEIRALELAPFEMRGMVSRRRVAHFGWRYGYESWRVEPGRAIPEPLVEVRRRLAEALALDPEELAQALVTEYAPGAGIGWHRDAPMFGLVAAVSLLSPCRFRFRRGKPAAREVRELQVLPRSMYALTGAARSEWQHSIPPAKAVRYSITFRTLRRDRADQPAG
jgi:alkylated DNA repair dioxygenase AlkB